MPITVRQLCSLRDFQLILRAGEDNDDRELSWAHVSELEDPTAFLAGGELLLTTGLSLPDDPGEIGRRVRRLVEEGVAAVGFGTGLGHDTIPDAYVRAAEHEQLPLLEVPLDVPFIHVEKAVAQALSSDDHARLQQSYRDQRRLIHATLVGEGSAALIRRTSQLIGGRIALLDVSGQIIDASHPGARRAVEQTAAARTARPREVVFAAEGGEDFISRPLAAADGDVLGHLVASREGVVGSLDHGVITVAAALLTSHMRRGDEAWRALSGARGAVLRLILDGEVAPVTELAAELWGGLPTPPVVVICAQGEPAATRAGARALQRCQRGSAAFALLDDDLCVVAGAEALDMLVHRLSTVPDLHVGISTSGGWDQIERARRESHQAVRATTARGKPIFFTEIGAMGLVACLDHELARAHAESRLAALIDAKSRDPHLLRETLQVWLANNGAIDPAATALGVHRHTLRRRLDRIGKLLGVDLDSPTTRAELWLELELLGGGSGRR
ncbi:PucR family transcriptional regulator [Nocardia sp. NPDC051750]|uniref:PucR family transcriptional regulator n=1 Tax=Nocardia sp. NPDC051750 TaxID=3364325 RepID=UPI0037AE567A